jgi:hypothetical protein
VFWKTDKALPTMSSLSFWNAAFLPIAAMAEDMHRKALIIVILFSYVPAEVLIRMPLCVHLGSGSQEFVTRGFLRPFCCVGFHLTQQLLPKFLLHWSSKLHRA